MGLSLWHLFKAGVLIVNSLMILHRKRFLKKFGLDDVNNMGCDPSEKPFKVQVIGLLAAVQYMKVPIIVMNSIIILFEMILGG